MNLGSLASSERKSTNTVGLNWHRQRSHTIVDILKSTEIGLAVSEETISEVAKLERGGTRQMGLQEDECLGPTTGWCA